MLLSEVSKKRPLLINFQDEPSPKKIKLSHKGEEKVNNAAKEKFNVFEENLTVSRTNENKESSIYIKINEDLGYFDEVLKAEIVGGQNEKSLTICTRESEDTDEDISEDFYLTLPDQWIDVLDELNDTGIENSTLELLRSDFVNELTESQKKAIFEFLKVSNQKNLLLASINLILPSDLRYELLEYGIAVNDLDIVKTAINGIRGQQKLNLITLTENKSFIALMIWKDLGVDPAILDLLQSISPFKNEDIRDGEWRKVLFNIWSLPDATFFLNGETIEYEGGLVNFFPEKIQESFESYKIQFPKKFTDELFLSLSSLIQSTKLSPSEKVAKFSKKESILIHGGSKTHLVDLLLMNGKFAVVCDKASSSGNPVQIFKIKYKIKESLLNKIESRDLNPKKIDKFFNKTLIGKLTGNGRKERVPHEWTKFLVQNWQGGLVQEANNCIYESTKTAFFAFAAMSDLLKTSNLNGISNSFQQITDWEMYFKCWSVAEYLKFCFENPGRIDRYLLDSIFLNGKQAEKIHANHPEFFEYFTKIEKLYNSL